MHITFCSIAYTILHNMLQDGERIGFMQELFPFLTNLWDAMAADHAMPTMPDQAIPRILDLALFGAIDHVLLSEDKDVSLPSHGCSLQHFTANYIGLPSIQ